MTANSGSATASDDESSVCDDGVRDVADLYAKHSRTLTRRLMRQTGDADVASELAHETFLRFVQRAPSAFATIARPEAYLWRVSTNVLRDWGRRRKLERRGCDAALTDEPEPVDQVAVLEARDTLRRLELVLDKLRPRTRQIFIAHRVRGLSYSEIAGETGLSVKGVEKQMAKAIAKIDRLLDRP